MPTQPLTDSSLQQNRRVQEDEKAGEVKDIAYQLLF